MTIASPNPVLQDPFDLQRFHDLYERLTTWRIFRGPYELKRGVLPFVQGLRFQALLIYTIRKMMKGRLDAGWGVIRDEQLLSPECDIIIHRPGACEAWNGGDSYGGPVMDFRFVKRQDAMCVISCKSLLTEVDAEYAEKVCPFTKRVWLFSECCRGPSVERQRTRAESAGYHKMWYLYRVDKEVKPVARNEKGWYDFVRTLHKLTDKEGRRSGRKAT